MASTADKKPSFLFPTTNYDNNTGVPKSPKSPKITIENPLLKRPQFMLGSTQMVAPNLTTTLRSDLGNHNETRSPLTSLSTNISQTTNKTPGPPPKASLSLMSMSVLPQTETTETAAVSGFRQSEFLPNPQKDQPMTPPPVNSPRLLLQQSQGLKPRRDLLPGDSNNWIVAYGYANREEYKELGRILNGYGQIQQQNSNANWLAIKYESRLSAEKALCSQPIKLSSNSLCGTVRGSPQLLQTLRAQQPNDLLKSAVYSMHAPGSEINETTYKSPGLSEEDILAQYGEHDGYDIDRRRSGSICEKMLAWFFEWDNPTHPHSD